MDVLEAPWTPERFIEWDNRQDAKHEFDGARIIPMTGGSAAHQWLVINIVNALVAQGELSRLQVLAEMRVKLAESVRSPDVSVTAAPVAPTTRTLTDAVVLFEVHSQETARIDQIDKLIEYATLPSIRHYVLIEQDRVGALVHTREAGRWITEAVNEGGAVALPAISATLPLASVYAGLTP